MRRCCRSGVTLVELLVVVAIIGILAALMLPAVQAARETARRATCQNNLRQIGAALHLYHDSHGELPIGCLDRRVPHSNPAGRQHAWSAAILPQLEEASLWQRINFAAAYDSPANAEAATVVVPVYFCPSTVRMVSAREGHLVTNPLPAPGSGFRYRGAAIDYGGIYGAGQTSPSANGVFLYDRAVTFREMTDGTSQTLAVAEDTGRGWTSFPQNGEWINGENIFDVGSLVNTQQDNEIWSDHAGGAMVLWCDSSASFLDEATDLAVLRAICTRARSDFRDNVK
jgi:prepilin-type N-terminal cleavage/methylation domain-containing protein